MRLIPGLPVRWFRGRQRLGVAGHPLHILEIFQLVLQVRLLFRKHLEFPAVLVDHIESLI